MKKIINIAIPIIISTIWISITSFLLDHFISRPTNQILQMGIIISIMMYTLGFIYYLYKRITNKNK